MTKNEDHKSAEAMRSSKEYHVNIQGKVTLTE